VTERQLVDMLEAQGWKFLTPPELEHRYGLRGEGPWSCEEVGRHFHVTTAHIQQVDNMAHRKLWEACASDEDLIDLIAQWNSVFPEKKGRRWFFWRGRSRSR
jgi:DNA-directed RNA polymerase sigma subunit (sigma70/sigma32)